MGEKLGVFTHKRCARITQSPEAPCPRECQAFTSYSWLSLSNPRRCLRVIHIWTRLPSLGRVKLLDLGWVCCCGWLCISSDSKEDSPKEKRGGYTHSLKLAKGGLQ